MIRCAALLRGVNLGGHKRVPMADLRTLLADELGYDDVVTYLASGNAVFSTGERTLDAVAERIRSGVLDRLGVDCAVLLRTADELADVVARNPWPHRAGEHKRLHVYYLEGPPAGELDPAATAPDEVVVSGREA